MAHGSKGSKKPKAQKKEWMPKKGKGTNLGRIPKGGKVKKENPAKILQKKRAKKVKATKKKCRR